MWTYRQASGCIEWNGAILGVGYSGALPLGRNNPQMQNVRMVGPIPQGAYLIGDLIDSAVHGPFALPLTPDPANEMFGRAGFLIHGDSIDHPGAASEGCIIMSRNVRESIRDSGDRHLTVEP
jgi:Protein of unknown function (DUF2778)